MKSASREQRPASGSQRDGRPVRADEPRVETARSNSSSRCGRREPASRREACASFVAGEFVAAEEGVQHS
jgi:hypothetical protein